MKIWSAEIKELEQLLHSVSGRLHELEKELIQLINAEDSNVVLLYSRRCLEVMVTDLCESDLNRPRKTEPLKGILDRLNKEEKVPPNIVTSMQNLNSLSVYGTHPKDFDPRQVKPVLNNLSTIIDWYLKHKGIEVEIASGIQEVVEAIESEKHPSLEKVDRSRKRSISLIAGFSIIILVLLFVFDVFNLFQKDRFEEIRDPDGRISIAVMPFENLTGDSSLNFWQNGISEFLINDLGNSEELAVLSSRVISEVLESQGELKTLSLSPAVARNVARKIRAGTHITGNYMGSGDNTSIMVNLVNTENGELIWSNRVDGGLVSGHYRYLLDSLSGLVSNFLEIKALEQQVNADQLNAFPSSAKAYQYYIDGLSSIVATDYESATESLLKAIEIDSNFTFAYFYLSWVSNVTNEFEQQMIWTQKTMELKHNLPSQYHPWINLWHACFFTKEREDIVRDLRLMEDAGIISRLYWFDIGVTYANFLGDFDKALEAYEKVEQLSKEWGGAWKYDLFYNSYSWALFQTGKHEKGKEIRETGLQLNSDNTWLIFHQAIADLSNGETLAAERNISALDSMVKKLGYPETIMEMIKGNLYYEAKDTSLAKEHLRRAYNLEPENRNRIYDLANVLIRYEVNVNEGMELVQKVLNDNPDLLGWRRLKGLALHKLGKHQEALEILRKAEEDWIGYHYLIVKDIQEVEKALTQAEE